MPVDFAAALRGGMAVVPDYAEAQARQQQLEQQQQAGALQAERLRMAAMEQNREIQAEAEWRADSAQAAQVGTPEAFTALFSRHPDRTQAITAMMGSMDRGTLRQMGGVWSMAQRGDMPGARQAIAGMIQQAQAAGREPDESVVELNDALNDPDPAVGQRALAMFEATLAQTDNGRDFVTSIRGPREAPTEFQRRAEYIRETEGEQAYRLFLRNSYDPLQTAQPGSEIDRTSAFDTRAGRGGDPASTGMGGGEPASAPPNNGSRGGTITPQQAQTIRQSMNFNDRQFNAWRRSNNVTVVGEEAPARRVRSLQEARSLPPGTRFIDPDGVERVR
ncbi:MAG: hypothetical protein V4696_07460 [Pseudomonadota bacterium]